MENPSVARKNTVPPSLITMQPEVAEISLRATRPLFGIENPGKFYDDAVSSLCYQF